MATTVEPSIHYQNLDAESIRMVGSVQETFSDFSIYSRGKQIVSKTTQKTHHQRCSSLHSLQTSSSLEHSFWAHKSRPPFFWYGANPQVWEIWWLGDLCVVPTSVIIWNSQRVVEPENFLHQPWSSEIWRSQNWIVQRPCHFWHTPIFQHKFQDFYAIMSWSTRKLQFRCIFQPQNWGKLQHRHFQVFYIITRSMSTSTLYRIRPSWHVRALNWLPKSKTMILQSIVLVFITTCCCWNPRVEVALQVAHLWNSQRLLYVLSQLCTISEDLAWTIAVLD